VAVVTVAGGVGGGETGRAAGSSASSASHDLGKSNDLKDKGEKADIETERARARAREADEVCVDFYSIISFCMFVLTLSLTLCCLVVVMYYIMLYYCCTLCCIIVVYYVVYCCECSLWYLV
jgi:hypothetical protein